MEPLEASPSGLISVSVSLNDISTSSRGLYLSYPSNYASPNYGDSVDKVFVDCTATFPVNASYNASMSEQCAWSGIEIEGTVGWLNATVSLTPDARAMLLTASVPDGVDASNAVVKATSYGWGPIPMLSVYDQASGLPVLPWNKPL